MGTGTGAASKEIIQPWPPEEAIAIVRKMANEKDFNQGFNGCWTDHIKEQLIKYALFSGDIIKVFQRGTISEEGELTQHRGIFRYKMFAETPNSNGRIVTLCFCVGGKVKDLKVTDLTVS